MDPGTLALALASLVFAVQMGELGLGVFNAYRIRALRREVTSSVARADKGREEIVSKLNELITALSTPPPASPGFNGIDPREARAAREDKADRAAVTRAEIYGQIGPIAAELWQQFAPDAWIDALKRPHLWMEIWKRLAPQIRARMPNVDQGNATPPGGGFTNYE